MNLVERLLESVEEIKIPLKVADSLLYPGDSSLTESGNDPILGNWRLDYPKKREGPWDFSLSPTDDLVVIRCRGWIGIGGKFSFAFTEAKKEAVMAFIKKFKATEITQAADDVSNALKKAEELWSQSGPFMINEVCNAGNAILRKRVSEFLEANGFKSRTIQLFKPIVVWFKPS